MNGELQTARPGVAATRRAGVTDRADDGRPANWSDLGARVHRAATVAATLHLIEVAAGRVGRCGVADEGL